MVLDNFIHRKQTIEHRVRKTAGP